MNPLAQGRSICAVAIVRDEEPFLDEWLVYHRLIGVDRFFLYDDDPALPLERILRRHAAYVTVVPWHGRSEALAGRNRQTKAYWDAATGVAREFSWVAFIDIDEFIVLREAADLPGFLVEFTDAQSVTINWHVFGHNGYFDDPRLVTAELTRRMAAPSPHGKSITRPEAIAAINSAHHCALHKGARHVDANRRPYSAEVYPGKTSRAHINHYQCRSFARWMRRVERGDVNVDVTTAAAQGQLWRVEANECLRKFVETVALDKNEMVDVFMRKYTADIERALAAK